MAVTYVSGSAPMMFAPAKIPTLIHTPRLLPCNPLLPIKTIRIIKSPRATLPHKKNVYPDPIPEFAKSETEKFRAELLSRLSKDNETFGDDLLRVVNVCSEIFSEFMHKEYGGPGTLLVEPFTDMLVSLKEKNLPGAPLAARTSLLWAQNHVDNDWQIWNSNSLD